MLPGPVGAGSKCTTEFNSVGRCQSRIFSVSTLHYCGRTPQGVREARLFREFLRDSAFFYAEFSEIMNRDRWRKKSRTATEGGHSNSENLKAG